MMRILADENMPIAQQLFSKHGHFETFTGRSLTATTAQTADVLLVRSVTQVNSSLLGEHRPGFVGTATIGVDHLDQAFLKANDIAYASAPGCNANSVAQFVLSSIATVKEHLSNLTVGVVAQGNVGRTVAGQLRALDNQVKVYDPHLSGLTDQVENLSDLAGVDVLCLHAPYITDGEHPTLGLVDQTLLETLAPNATVISAGRGGVLNELAIKQLSNTRPDIKWVLDVWHKEPDVDLSLIPFVEIATPHIAGHSVEGKRMGTVMLYQRCCELFNWPSVSVDLGIEPFSIRWPGSIEALVLAIYDVREDDKRFRAAMQLPKAVEQFDLLRKNYPKRYEPRSYRVEDAPDKIKPTLTALGFEVADV